MADEQVPTQPMSFEDHLRAVWQALEQVSELAAKQAREIEALRLQVKRLEEIIERLPTQPLDN